MHVTSRYRYPSPSACELHRNVQIFIQLGVHYSNLSYFFIPYHRLYRRSSRVKFQDGSDASAT